jgi:hypothetical protein
MGKVEMIACKKGEGGGGAAEWDGVPWFVYVHLGFFHVVFSHSCFSNEKL